MILSKFEKMKNGRIFLPTVLSHHKMLNIKLGTSVHLKTCIVWLISLCWLSGRHRSRFLWKCYRCALFPLPSLCSTPLRLSVLQKPGFWPFFWRRWGSESWQTRHSTPFFRYRTVTTSFQQIFPHVVSPVPAPLMKATFAEVRLWMVRHIESLFQGLINWWL